MKLKLSVLELNSLCALLSIAGESIKNNKIPKNSKTGEPLMCIEEAKHHFQTATKALQPYINEGSTKFKKKKEQAQKELAELQPEVQDALKALIGTVDVVKVEIERIEEN